MKLMSWNVNGIRSVVNKGFEEFLNTYNPDILCLQETKAQKDQVDLDFKQYEEIWNSAHRKGYAGTAIFAKIKPISLKFGLAEYDKKVVDAYGDASKEGRVITAEYPDFFVVNVYTPNSKPDLSRLEFRYKIWDPYFLDYVLKLEKTKPVIFCGDLNVAHKEIDLARPKENRKNAGFTDEERKGFDNIISAGFIDTFRQFNQNGGNYTWWSNFGNSRARNIGWRIDYFCVSSKLKDSLINADILPNVMGSDHCPILLEI